MGFEQVTPKTLVSYFVDHPYRITTEDRNEAIDSIKCSDQVSEDTGHLTSLIEETFAPIYKE